MARNCINSLVSLPLLPGLLPRCEGKAGLVFVVTKDTILSFGGTISALVGLVAVAEAKEAFELSRISGVIAGSLVLRLIVVEGTFLSSATPVILSTALRPDTGNLRISE